MKQLTVFLLLFVCVSVATAQNKYKQADTYYLKANEAFNAEEYDTACLYADKHLSAEFAIDTPRNGKVVEAYIIKAFCEFRAGNYRGSIETYNLALPWLDNASSADFAKSFFQFIDLCYVMMESTDEVYYNFSDKDYRKSFVFRIDSVLWRKGNKFRVQINAGQNDGVIMGAVAFPISRPLPDTAKQRLFQLGKGEIVSLGPWSAEAEVEVYDSNDIYNWVYAGDMIETRIFSKVKDETILYKLLGSDVSFLNNNWERMVNPRYILHYDSKAFLSLQLLLMAKDVLETEEFTREGSVFLDPAVKGQNQGKSINMLFANPDTADIKDFLGFVSFFPRKYMGKDFKINETYATWLLNNSPSTPGVILDSLLNEDNPARRLQILEFNKSDLEGDFYTNWTERATEYAGKQQAEMALKANDRVLEAAAYFKKSEIKAIGFVNRGSILKDFKQYDESIRYYDSASKTYLLLKDTIEHIRALYKIADGYGDWGKYKQAVENFDKAIAQLTKKTGKKGTYTEWELMAYILWDKGYTISQKGDYDGALAAYSRAEKILDSIGGSKSDRANVYRNVAYVSKKKGLYEQALEKYTHAKDLFFAAGNQEKYATCLDDIADTYFKMGNYRQAIAGYEDAYAIKLTLDDKSGAGFSRSNIGQAYWNLGMYDSAKLSHAQAVSLRKQGNDIVGTAYSYEKIGELWKESGNFDSSIYYYQSAEAYYLANNDTTDKLASLKLEVGNLFYSVKNYTQAIYYYKRAGQIYQSINNDLGIANSLYNQGLSYYYLKSFVQARDMLAQAKTAYEKMKDKENIMNVITYQAFIAWEADNDYPGAEKLLRNALVLAKESNSLTNTGYTYNQLGRLKTAQGQLEGAKKYYDSSLTAYVTSGDYSGAGYTKLNLGYYYIDKGLFDKSRQLYLEVATEAVEKKNFLLASNAYNYLADYYNLTGEYDSAKLVANQSLALNKESKNNYIEAGCYISLGNTYNYLADYKTAVKYYRLADSIYITEKDITSRSTPKNNVGTIYFYQGDYRNALTQFYEVYEQLKKENYQGDFLITALLNIGEVYLEDGVLPEAEKWLKLALEAAKKSSTERGVASANLLLGKVKLKQKNYKEAKGYLFAAHKSYREFGEKERIIEANTFIGKLYYETGKDDSARFYLTNAIAVAEQTGNTKYQWEPLYISSSLYLKKKDTANAVGELKKAVNILENIKGNIAGRKESLVSFAKAGDKQKMYQGLVELLIAQNDVSMAFYYQEKSNIVGLMDQTRGGDNGPTRSNDLLGEAIEDNTAKELELKIDGYYTELIKERSKPKDKQSQEKILALEALIGVNETNYNQFVDSMVKAGGNEAASFSTSINPRDLDDARFSLGDDDAVIEYLSTENQLLIFVATNNSLNARKVNIPEADLAQALNDFYAQVSTAKTNDALLQANTDKLYQLFIAPIADLIDGKKRLALVPTGVVYKLPIQSLGKVQDGKMRYLITDYEITYINNIKFVYQTDAGGSITVKAVLFGNPDNSLANAEKEVNDIQHIIPACAIYVRDSATEDKAKEMILRNYNVVHFATHGRLDPVIFENSYLVMAPNAVVGDDGRLTMNEIRQFKNLRSVRLLVLSACDMAVKEEKIEGWVNTPANEFILKGVGSVIAPLWKVHDEATSLLMITFYQNIKDGQGISQSLRNAQLTLAQSDKFSHPYYWSAFEVIGKW